MFKNKIFIFDQLNYQLLPIAMFHRIIGRKIYFLRLPKTWQNKKYIKFLKSLGLNWLNYQDYAIKGHAEIVTDNVWSQKQFGNFIDGLNIANALKLIADKHTNG